MAKKKIIFIFVIFIIITLSIVIALSFSFKDKPESSLNIPSMCYTNLQPKSFLSNGRGLITENHLENYVKIEIPDREFKTTQSSDTGSMHPTISNKADLIEIIPKEEDLGVGDIIVFNCNNKLIRHRIIKIENETYFTKGDSNPTDDAIAFGCNTKFSDIKSKIVGIIY